MALSLPPVPYTKSWATIVADFVAAAQSSSATPLDFSEGSVFLALAEASAGNADWLQKLFLFALLVSRLQTSQGQWVDTWTADFMPAVAGTNSPRLPATPATGSVTFTSSAPQSQRVIPVGALVATSDGSQVYQVYADTSNAAYSVTIIPGGGFVLPAGQASLAVNVLALTPGTAGNVLANTVTVIRSSVIGVDTVTNPLPLTTGIDQESDAALKARFKDFIQALRAGTTAAITYVIESLQQGLQSKIHENVDPDGATDYGAVTVYVYGGANVGQLITSAATATTSDILQFAGPLPSWLTTGMVVADQTNFFAVEHAQTVVAFDVNANTVTLSADVDQTVNSGDVIVFNNGVVMALAAVNTIRAAGVRPIVVGASVLQAIISMTIVVAPGYNGPLVVAAVANAIGAYVNSLTLEAPLRYTMLANVAYQASPGVANATSVLLNNGTADLIPTAGQIIRATADTINIQT